MNGNRGFMITLLLFGMELTWVYTWACFTMTGCFNRPFPLSSAIFASVLSFLLTGFSIGRGWRWIGIIGIQLLGLGLACLWTLYLMEMPGLSFFNTTWVNDFFSRPKTFLQWAALAIALFWVLCFWIGGILLSRRPDTYDAVSNRFDLGTGALLFLLLIELVVLIKGGSSPTATLTTGGLFSFFIISVLAFSLTRNKSDGDKGFISGYQGISTVVGFVLIILLVSGALVSFLLPYLTLTAQAGYEVLKIASQPLGSLILNILRFMFTNRELQSGPSSTSQSPQHKNVQSIPAEEGGWFYLIMAITGWVLAVLVILVVLIVVLFLLWKLMNLLLIRTAVREKPPGIWRDLIQWILKMRTVLAVGLKRIQTWFKGPQTAVQLYLSLMIWGRRSGIAFLPSDTPLEYSMRLRKIFPSMDHEIQSIIKTHNNAVYGRIQDATGELAHARASLAKLRRPVLWPARLRSRLFPTY
jgi:hypothetical protein